MESLPRHYSKGTSEGRLMEIILIILAGILMGAFNFGFFLLGYYVRSKKKEEDAVVVTEENRDFIEEMMKWRNYNV